VFKRVKAFLLKIIKINDTAHKISLGFAVGVTLGVIPTTGPLASFFVALLLRANPLSAVLGSLLVNTWLSFIILIPAAKIGGLLLNLNWQSIYKEGLGFFRSFNWQNLLKISIYKIILPILIGYAIIGIGLGIIGYIVCRLILNIKNGDKNRDSISG